MSRSEAQELVGSFGEMLVEARDPSVAWPLMLERLQEAIRFDAGYIAASWGNAMEGRGAIADHDEPFLKRNLGRFLAEIRPEEVAMYTDRARIHHDVWPRPRQLELAVFREVLDPTGMRHMIVRVSVRHGNVAGFNLERRDAGCPYGERELQLVDLVAPFLHIVELLTLRPHDEAITNEFASEWGLTKRETEFVTLTARGLQNSEIAMLTRVSANTVRNTLARIFEKVGVASRAELAYFASRSTLSRQPLGLVAPPPSLFPDDGLPQFTERVRQACAEKPPADAARPARAARIVYTPPLTNLDR